MLSRVGASAVLRRSIRRAAAPKIRSKTQYSGLSSSFPAPAYVRAFSTDGKPKEDYSSIEEDEERDGANTASPDSPMEKYANQIKVGAGLAAGSVVFYGISRLFYDVAYQFLALTPAISLKYGFYGGSLTAFGVTAMGYGVARGLQPNPEGAFRQGLALANANEDLRSLLGGTCAQDWNYLIKFYNFDTVMNENSLCTMILPAIL